MSSPPPYNPAGSPPPGIASLQNPRKRLSLSTSNLSPTNSHNGGPTPKRRKPSFAPSAGSSSAHPLRQTSFPPPEFQNARSATGSRQVSYSPAIGEEAASVSSFGAGRSKKGGRGTSKRGGKSGSQSVAGTSAHDDDDADTAVGGFRGGKGSKKRGKAAAAKAAAEEEEAEDDDDDDGAQGEALFDGAREMDDAAKAQEGEHRMILYETLSQEQRDRYDIWNRQALRKNTVRKIVNQTLSQSVPQSIVLTVSASAKVFIGDLVEKARDVQTEWLACESKWPTGEEKEEYSTTGGKAATFFDVKEMDKGPLTPDHLREALRRYKKDREGGGAGLLGMSLHGKDAVASRTSGRRLFK